MMLMLLLLLLMMMMMMTMTMSLFLCWCVLEISVKRYEWVKHCQIGSSWSKIVLNLAHCV